MKNLTITNQVLIPKTIFRNRNIALLYARIECIERELTLPRRPERMPFRLETSTTHMKSTACNKKSVSSPQHQCQLFRQFCKRLRVINRRAFIKCFHALILVSAQHPRIESIRQSRLLVH